MITKIYFDYYTECEIIVEEMERKEAISYTTDFIDGIELSKLVVGQQECQYMLSIKTVVTT